MALLNLPPLEENNFLRQPSKEVALEEIISPEMTRLIEDMKETMSHWQGIGLAAVQLVKPIKLIIALSNEGDIYPLFNGKITKVSATKEKMLEGCLSLPGVLVEVERPVGVTVEYLDERGLKRIKKVAGLEAKILQHEIDHTEGVLITDHGSLYKRHNIG